MLNKEKFVNTMVGLCDLYGKVPSEFMLDTYYSIFADYDNAAFDKAIGKCLKVKVYNNIPKPAEIMEFLEGTREDKETIAWFQVMDAVRKGGYYSSIEFSDPVISHCINELGGWSWFCSQDKDQLPFIEKRFMDIYRLLAKRGVNENIRLIGFVEAQNNRKGYPIPEPIRIGFEVGQKLLIDEGRGK